MDPARYTEGQEADRNFTRGRRRALLGRLTKRVGAWAGRCCSVAGRKALGLAACFSEEHPKRSPGLSESSSGVGGVIRDKRDRIWLGPREVELSRIVGSVGRCREFDQDFRPLKQSLKGRWKGVYEALAGGKMLPPVKLIKVGERYFVEDGNHRVSVARYRGALMIDAEVTEVTEVTGVSTDAGSTAGPTGSARESQKDHEQARPQSEEARKVPEVREARG